jgi:hypothetical protein
MKPVHGLAGMRMPLASFAKPDHARDDDSQNVRGRRTMRMNGQRCGASGLCVRSASPDMRGAAGMLADTQVAPGQATPSVTARPRAEFAAPTYDVPESMMLNSEIIRLDR